MQHRVFDAHERHDVGHAPASVSERAVWNAGEITAERPVFRVAANVFIGLWEHWRRVAGRASGHVVVLHRL